LIRNSSNFLIKNLSYFLESNSTETKKISCPDFSQYLYFLFAPTLIYCDKYPRNTVIHWDYVLQMFGQVLAAIIYVYYIVVRFCVPTFANLNQNQITLPIFISVLFNSIMPGSLFLLLGEKN
jgi:sterol O-acyltransferase